MMPGQGFYRFDSDDDIITRDPKLWRNGPASHIYDQLGIPDDCNNLDYSEVLDPKEDFLELDSEEREYRQLQLELAVQSILPPDKAESYVRDDCVLQRSQNMCPQQRQRVQAASAVNVVKRGMEVSKSPAKLNEVAVPSDVYVSLQKPNSSNHLRQLVSELEEAAAITKLKNELESKCEDDSFYGIPEKGQVENTKTPVKDIIEDNFSLVSQILWENDIIWEIPKCVGDSQRGTGSKERQTRAGWIPTQENRKATDGILIQTEPGNFRSILPYENEDLIDGSWEDEVIWNADEFRFQFPYPRPKLPVFDTADDDIVFQMPVDVPLPDQQQSTPNSPPKRHLVQPHTFKSKMILGKVGVIQSRFKRERFEQQAREVQEKLNSAGNIADPKSNDFWNISHDHFFESKTPKHVSIYNCRHSRLVKELVPPFILTHLTTDQLRNFHRPKLSATINAPTPSGKIPGRHYFKSLSKRIQFKLEENSKLISDGQPIPFDKEIDLSGRDGTIIMIENSEEFPPLLCQVGMCSQLINYYRRKSLKEEEYAPSIPHTYGETHYVSNSSYFPFLGTLESGQVLSSICNNMYHSPIYWHGKNETDFLVIRSKMSGYLIREIDGLFAAGQQCPLIEVPEPNSNKVKILLKDLVQAFVYLKYIACYKEKKVPINSSGIVPKIRMDLLTQHFPILHENNIKAILKNSSELRRIGNVLWLVKKSGFQVPPLEEFISKCPPEQICAYYSLLAAEQRLRDAGFDSMLALPDRCQDELDGKKGKRPLNPHCALFDVPIPGTSKTQQTQVFQSAFDEELLSAPWNTTSAFISASKGKCFLQVTGPADPTGCGEGFSYVRVAKRAIGTGGAAPGPDGEPIPQHSGRGRPRKHPPKTGGTDADLRKLSAKTAKDLLRKVGVPDKEIQKLTRWEVIDLVRTLSTEKVMQGEAIDKTITKFCRWKSIHSLAMNQERYKEACQRVFELQNKVLSSGEVLSTDDEDSEDDESVAIGGSPLRGRASQRDIEQMGKNIERILSGDGDIDRMTHEEEELERLELQKMMLGGVMAKDADIVKRKEALEREKELTKKSKENSKDILTDLMKNPGKVLRITRTFKSNGESFMRTEIVRDPVVIAAYLRIRESKSEEFIKQFLLKADRRDKKEQKQKDRILLGQLQGIAKVEELKVIRLTEKRKREMEDEYFPNKEAKIQAEKAVKRQRRKCGACGLPGHVKTSKDCPMYNPEKIEEMIKKRENKKLKKSQSKLKLSVSQSQSQIVLEDKEEDEFDVVSDPEESSLESCSSVSDEDNDLASDTEGESDEEGNPNEMESTVSSQEEPIVKTDGLKMFVKKSSIQESLAKAQEQEAKEQEVARILATMAMERATGGTPDDPVPRRRISQAERENADYLNDRKYKTTAADRRSARL